MKKLFLILALTISIYPQSSKMLLLMDDGVSYIDPLEYDAANTLALYDGDLELSTTAWNNQMSASFDMTLTGEPSVTTSTLNGHKVVTLNGTDEYGEVRIATLDIPVTYYVVFRALSYTANDYLFDADPVGSASTFAFRQYNADPNYSLSVKGSLQTNINPSISINSWYILTCNVTSDSAFYSINGVQKQAYAPASGVADPNGFTLVSRAVPPTGCGNFEIAYIILRKVRDSDAVNAEFEAYLANRFGITLP